MVPLRTRCGVSGGPGSLLLRRISRCARSTAFTYATVQQDGAVAVYGLRMIVRDADPQRDAAVCAAIYGPYVSDSVVSFEARQPTVEEMAARISASHAWVVAYHEGLTLGYAYAYASPHRERAAYRWAADVAVYIKADHHRSGVGRALYTQLFEQLRSAYGRCALGSPSRTMRATACTARNAAAVWYP